MKPEDLPSDQLVGVYIQIRDARAARKAAYTIDDEKDKKRQEKIEGLLLARLDKDGVESIRTAVGTAYKSTKSSATVASWDDFFMGYVVPNGAWELLERRCSKDAVVQYKAENAGNIPPGLNWREEIVVNVRRSA